MTDTDTDWQSHTKSITERGKYILEKGLWSDCNFIITNEQNKKEFKAHKLILSMSSPVFEIMFQKEFIESQGDIYIDDIQPDIFEAMLRHIYTDKIEIESFKQACDLYYVANKYVMPTLLKNCIDYIYDHVDYQNACHGYEFATLFDQPKLMERCKQIIITNISSVVFHTTFSEIQLSTLKMILQENTLNISEVELFESVKNWVYAEFVRRDIDGKEHIEKQQALKAEVVPHIRFLSMSASEFAEGPAKSDLLTKDQAFAVLMNISSSKCDYPMPDGFCTTTRTRHAPRVIFGAERISEEAPPFTFRPTFGFQSYTPKACKYCGRS